MYSYFPVSGTRITRRDFLRLLGYGVTAITGAAFFRHTTLGDPMKLSAPLASAQSLGSWTLGQNTSIVAIHAALLPNGKIFYLAGSGFHGGQKKGPFEARILDPINGSEKNLQQADDLFCIGQCQLQNGNILIAGGTLMYDTDVDNCNGAWHGLNAAYELDVSSESLLKVSSMAHGRWYPTCVTLSDGQVFVANGFDEYGIHNRLVEVYDPNSKSWTKSFDPATGSTYCVGQSQEADCPGAGSLCYGGPNNGVAPNVGIYPRAHLMPSGLVVTCGGSREAAVRTWAPSTGAWRAVATTSMRRDYGTSFLLPLNNTVSERGKILVVGGSPTSGSQATTTAEIIDFNAGTSTAPIVRFVASISKRRKYLLPIILPDGKCVIFAGSEQGVSVPVYIPEMFDAQTETWTSLAAASVPRVYHGVALLLADGRVWTAGSTPNRATWELRIEIFAPAYYFEMRPAISGSPAVGDYGGTIVIPTLDALNINSVSLLRLGCTTHHYDTDIRLIWLQILDRSSNSITVSAPINPNIAPPGYYMIHILDTNNVPSAGKIIAIPGADTGADTIPPAKVLGLTVTPISGSQLSLAWTANTEPDLAHYNVYRGTTAGFSVNPATDTPLAQPTTNSYSNTGLTESTTYYYKVAAVDTSGNIGILSDEGSGTTLDTIFYNVTIPGNSSGELKAGGNIRAGEEANTVSSLIIGKSLKSWKIRLRKRGSPSGNVTAKVRRRSDDAIIATFNETFNSATFSTYFAEFIFTLSTPHTIAHGDKIMIEYNGAPAIDIEAWGEDKFNGSNTRRIKYDTTYIGFNSQDVTGTMSS
jgi:hypothetical protein